MAKHRLNLSAVGITGLVLPVEWKVGRRQRLQYKWSVLASGFGATKY